MSDQEVLRGVVSRRLKATLERRLGRPGLALKDEQPLGEAPLALSSGEREELRRALNLDNRRGFTDLLDRPLERTLTSSTTIGDVVEAILERTSERPAEYRLRLLERFRLALREEIAHMNGISPDRIAPIQAVSIYLKPLRLAELCLRLNRSMERYLLSPARPEDFTGTLRQAAVALADRCLSPVSARRVNGHHPLQTTATAAL